MADLQARLKALLYAASGAASVDMAPKTPAPPPPLPALTKAQMEAMDECGGIA